MKFTPRTRSALFLLAAFPIAACGSTLPDDEGATSGGEGTGGSDAVGAGAVAGDGDSSTGTGATVGDGDVGTGAVVGDGDTSSGGSLGDGDGDTGTGGTPAMGDPPGESCALGTNYNVGELRLLNNQWNETQDDQCIFINADRSFGWSWDVNLSGAAVNADYPNYPEVEFGINPWGRQQDPWEVLPSSTTLLPIQLKNLTSASMIIDVTSTTNGGKWNLAFETWLSPVDPRTGVTAPSAELMVFLGNSPGYEPETPLAGSVGTYTLFQSENDWGEAPGYVYRQYRSGMTGNSVNFDGTLDIKAFLDASGFNGEWWITRFEIGNEVYNGSSGETTIDSLSFEVNGQTRSAL